MHDSLGVKFYNSLLEQINEINYGPEILNDIVFENASEIIRVFVHRRRTEGDYVKMMEEVSELFKNIVAGSEMFNAYIKGKHGYNLDLGSQIDSLPFVFVNEMIRPENERSVRLIDYNVDK